MNGTTTPYSGQGEPTTRSDKKHFCGFWEKNGDRGWGTVEQFFLLPSIPV